MSFPKYESYKASGVEWLGEVPEHWELKRISHLIRQSFDGMKIGPFGSQLTSQMLSDVGFKVYGQENVIANDFNRGERFISEDKFRELKVYEIKPEDILVTMMGTSGRCAIAPNDIKVGIMDSHLLRMRVTDVISPKFLRLLIDESVYVAYQVRVLGKGSIMHGLNSSIVKELLIAVPPVSEQKKLLTFLDRETAKIDALIAEQQRLIELLKEKRQALISHAVTKGLNPDAPMKDSGIEWLGEVPAHWTMIVAKRVSSVFVPQRNKPELNNEGSGINWATMDDMKSPEILQTNNWVSYEAAKNAGSRILGKGAVIASCVGNFDVAAINAIDLIINQQLQAYILKSEIKAEFFRYFLGVAKVYFEQIGTAATLTYVNQQGFENLPLPLPTKDEQERIISFLSTETTKLDTLTAEAQRAIELLKERRTALIASAVTGKIDVRQYSSEPTPEAATP